MSEERKFELRNENYFVVSGWMINDLKLSGSELIAYAVIYSFSQEKNSWCYASQEYLASWLNSTVRTVQRTLDSLLEKKLIVKRIETDEEGRFNIYKAFRHPYDSEKLAELTSKGGHDKMTSPSAGGSRHKTKGVTTKLTEGHDISGEYTLLDNKEDNKDNNKEGANAPAPQKTSRFSKPSISEIAAYCSEKNISIDPASFYYFYESKGWKVGNAPMKNWKAAVQTWAKRNRTGYSGGYNSSYSAKPNSCGHNNPEGFDEF